MKNSSLGLVAAATAAGGSKAQTPTPGAPPAFNTSAAIGPEVSATTFSEAKKVMQVTMTQPHVDMAVASWRTSMAALYERRTGPRKVALEETLAPYSTWNPVLPGSISGPARSSFVRSKIDSQPVPAKDEAIAYASVAQLACWIEKRQLTSERLTNIYLERLEQFNPKLRCVITLTREHALRQARGADKEIALGHYRGPLHGIPWGGKDLLDTAGIPTTYGAEPFQNRIPKRDAVVIARLNEAGAVLVAKLSLGALALNDIWFGGQTVNPWLLEEGASGSSAGPLRCYGLAAYLWTRAAHWCHDAVLVTRQAWSHDARSGRWFACVARNLWPRCGRRSERAQQT